MGGVDLSNVNWVFVGLMAVLAFVAALLGSLIAFRNRFAGAVIAGILFAGRLHCLELLSAQFRPADREDVRERWRPRLVDLSAGPAMRMRDLPGEMERV